MDLQARFPRGPGWLVNHYIPTNEVIAEREARQISTFASIFYVQYVSKKLPVPVAFNGQPVSVLLSSLTFPEPLLTLADPLKSWYLS